MKREKEILPKVIIFSDGTKLGGGSGLKAILEEERNGNLRAEIVGVVSRYEFGGVRTKAFHHRKKFFHFTGPFTAREYQKIIRASNAEWVVLSGWLKPFRGHDPRKTINKHPALLPEYGGKGMYGRNVHKKVLEDYKAGKIEYTAFSMHFVIDDTMIEGDFYDKGPVFFESPKILLRRSDTLDTIENLIKTSEHSFEYRIIDDIIHERIRWVDVSDPTSTVFPENYAYLPRSAKKQ